MKPIDAEDAQVVDLPEVLVERHEPVAAVQHRRRQVHRVGELEPVVPPELCGLLGNRRRDVEEQDLSRLQPLSGI